MRLIPTIYLERWLLSEYHLGISVDRMGAGLDLPNFMRWAAAGETLD